MTDNEIIKALGNIQNHKWICAKADNGDPIRIGDVADLINRQKAEIERLESEMDKQYEIASGGTSMQIHKWCMNCKSTTF